MNKQKNLQHVIHARIDHEKYEELNRLFSRSAYRSMSELVRAIICDKKIKIITYDKSMDMLLEKLSAIRSELNAIGTNINQVTRWFNTESNPSGKVYHSMKIATLYLSVGKKVEELLSLIAKIWEQWLQK